MNVLQKEERGEARLLARASFLHSIPRVRPIVVKDLWRTALPEFKELVLLGFNQEIFEGVDKDKFLKEKEEQFLGAPERSGDYLIHLLQQKLSPRFTALGTVPDSVRHEFFSTYALAQTQDCKPLLTRIQEWSRRWNLDAEWCRDHALATLRAWLFFYGSRTPGARPSARAYVSVAHVAAIIPNRIAHGRYDDETRYRVYLKGRMQTIEVVAHEFDSSGETVVFYWLPVRNNELGRDLVENFYLVKSEVVGIFPVEGLGY